MKNRQIGYTEVQLKEQIKKLYNIMFTDHTKEIIGVDEYTEFVKEMKVYPEKFKIIYPAMKLNGEAGEIAEKVGKWMRGDKETLDKEAILKECGDVLWYITALATDCNFTLQDVINTNVEKLTARKEQRKVKGDGDNREEIVSEYKGRSNITTTGNGIYPPHVSYLGGVDPYTNKEAEIEVIRIHEENK